MALFRMVSCLAAARSTPAFFLGRTLAPVSPEQLEKAVAILGSDGISDDGMEEGVAALVGDPLVARRLIDWIPEAFGIIVISHMAKVDLPTTFSAKNAKGKWVDFPFEAEPIFEAALRLAANMFHTGPRGTVRNIANRSAMISAVNSALMQGPSIEGGKLSGPALIGIPAEVYKNARMPFWKRLFCRLG